MKPELIVAIMLLLLLVIHLVEVSWSKETLLHFINIMLAIHLFAGLVGNQTGELFGGMYTTGSLQVFEKSILALGTLIISLQSYHWLKAHDHVIEFYVLLLSTLMGMYFMISSNNILLFYLSLELSTIPLAALANFDLEKRRSSEAALKMILSSGFSSAILLMGISFLYGTTGTISFSELTPLLNGNPLQLFAFVLLIAGFGFKISAVPFHLWTADVYEGAPVPVTAYLSVVSKGAVLFVFATVLYKVFQPLHTIWYQVIFILSVITMIIGNLFALRQQQIKRLLAFSSIAQVGFILIGISSQSLNGSSSVVYFVLVYMFSNLGAFGVISLVSSITGKELIDDYKGFYQTNPLLSWVLALSLFSLAGIPPTAGFFGKFFLLLAGAGKGNYWLVGIAALNVVISLYYYLMVVKAIFMDKNNHPIPSLTFGLPPKIAIVMCVAGILITGLMSGVYQYIFDLI